MLDREERRGGKREREMRYMKRKRSNFEAGKPFYCIFQQWG